MKRLIEEIRACVGNEYKRAAEMHGKTFNSFHEAYGVILEEFEESKEESERFEMDFSILWAAIRENDNEYAVRALSRLREHAEKTAAEFAQCAAMCHKATFLKDGEL